jgi:DNA-binding response OmpR family regulator
MATILVVDDEMGIRELLSEILSDEGHVVEAAENAQEAREFRLRQAPDLVLLDIWMPDTDGVTLLKEWAAQGQLTMPVIMMSGHATIDTAVEATKIGALNFLEKPIALQKLLKAVEQGLARGAGCRGEACVAGEFRGGGFGRVAADARERRHRQWRRQRRAGGADGIDLIRHSAARRARRVRARVLRVSPRARERQHDACGRKDGARTHSPLPQAEAARCRSRQE